MKQNRKAEWILWALVLLPAAAVLAALPWLPAQVPMHWNIAGTVDRWGSKYEFAAIPLCLLALQIFLKWVPALDPKRENYQRFSSAYFAVRLGLAVFCLVLEGASLWAAFFPDALDIGKLIMLCGGALFCVLGNFMPKFKHNYFVGIRTPWTLANEAVWNGTHRMAGWLWAAGGTLMIVCSFFLQAYLLFTASMVIVLVCGLVPCIYSYILYKKQAR